jgi:hypothetical protein
MTVAGKTTVRPNFSAEVPTCPLRRAPAAEPQRQDLIRESGMCTEFEVPAMKLMDPTMRHHEALPAEKVGRVLSATPSHALHRTSVHAGEPDQ